ncbi:hypothetical protein BsWGS_18809 [Bradybaena similaris]
MWDLKRLINQCVKCESKFTAAEKPLKLLPCLHSMCLDCLYGRTPVRCSSKGAVVGDSKTALKEDGVCEAGREAVGGAFEKDQADEGTKDNDERETVALGCRDGRHSVGRENQNVTDTGMGLTVAGGGEAAVGTPTAEDTADVGLSVVDKNEHELQCSPDLKPMTECPICRDPIDQPSTALMDNMFAALDPDLSASPKLDSTHVCTACEEDQEASSYCLQCEEWLCESCVDAHRRVRITKDHTISPKEEVKVVTHKSPWEQLMTCKQHKQEQLKFFCEKCETLTCRDCQLMDHKEHKYQFLDQAAEQYKARLKGSLALMGEKRTKLAASRDEIEQKLQNCKEQKDTLQQDILKQADILVKGIRQAVWGVLSNLASFTDAATKRLNKEIDDVSDLIGKFDHCIQFMEDILRDGSSMSLLYAKGNVETKCRKVYHTQVDPQSLKGTLSIVYKHDVRWLLGNLNKIGSIYVNGVRYPPEKNGGQGSRQSPSCGYQDPRAAGFTATSPHLQHMANQNIPGQRVLSDWTKFIQTVSKSSSQNHGPPNMTMTSLGTPSALPPQLTLPSNRRAQGNTMVPSWQAPAGVPISTYPGHFVAGQLMTAQQQQVPKPSFTPMRLHHRPAAQNAFPGQSDHRSQSIHSPPHYRMGGEASGTPRSSHSTPDPARPASAGMYDGNGRPDSEGGSAVVDIKKEKGGISPDCVIMSAGLQSGRSSIFPSPSKQSETILEMQRNLDEILRAVPMDLSDNMEQITESKVRTGLDVEHLGSPTLPAVSLTDHDTACEEPESPSDEELRENWQGGNSMPGFSLSQVDIQGDPNDDYCACCHNGGDVLCCDQCPKVYHLQCHIPKLTAVPSASFVCTICEGDCPVSNEEITYSENHKSTGMSDHETKVCERILLELFCHPSSIPFQEPVNRELVPDYYRIITQPVDFTQVKDKLQHRHPKHYKSIKSFLYDLRQVFINCGIYNKMGSDVAKAGQILRALFESLVERLIPQYLGFTRENPTPCFTALQQQQIDLDGSCADKSSFGESAPKRMKIEGVKLASKTVYG